MKLLIVGDLHIRGTNPRHRLGNYMFDVMEKLEFINLTAKEHEAAVIQTGDIFDSPSVSYSIFSETLRAISKYSNTWYTISGNHDLLAHNLYSIDRTPYGALMAANVIEDIHAKSIIKKDFILEGQSFNYTTDDGTHTEYTSCFADAKGSHTKILVVHGMLMPHAPVFDKYTLIKDIAHKTPADIVISGHYHKPFIERANGKLFINPGSVMRISAAEEELTRMPHVVLLDTVTKSTTVIPIACASPGEAVLDREQLIEDNTRIKNMEKFMQSLDITSESRYLDIQSILEHVIKEEKMQQEEANKLLGLALHKLHEARQSRK